MWVDGDDRRNARTTQEPWGETDQLHGQREFHWAGTWTGTWTQGHKLDFSWGISHQTQDIKRMKQAFEESVRRDRLSKCDFYARRMTKRYKTNSTNSCSKTFQRKYEIECEKVLTSYFTYSNNGALCWFWFCTWRRTRLFD